MLLSELEMSGPRENSVGARTWAFQVGSLDNVAHLIFRHRNLNKHLRFHIIRADGLGCGRGQRGVLKKNLRGRGAYSKKLEGQRGVLKKTLNTQRKFEYPKTHTKHHNRVLKKKLSTPQVPTTTNPGYSKKNWVSPGASRVNMLGISPDLPPCPPHEAVCLFRTHITYTCLYACSGMCVSQKTGWINTLPHAE